MATGADIIVAGGVLGMIGLLMRFLNGKIDKKADQSACDSHVKVFEKDGEKLDALGLSVSKIEERTRIWEDQGGFGNKEK